MLFIAALIAVTSAIAGAAAFFSVYGLAYTFSGVFWSVVAIAGFHHQHLPIESQSFLAPFNRNYSAISRGAVRDLYYYTESWHTRNTFDRHIRKVSWSKPLSMFNPVNDGVHDVP